MTNIKQLGLLRDILDSAVAIRTYIDGINESEFLSNQEKQDAVLRRFEIIGEATSRLAPDTRKNFSTLPFDDMRGMRNIIAHEYGNVDMHRIWHTASTDLDSLITTLEEFLKSQP
jgi:uncharacterized protein with HEPN domain